MKHLYRSSSVPVEVVHPNDVGPPAGQCVLLHHKNWPRTARGTWHRGEGIHLASECSRSKSDRATWDLPQIMMILRVLLVRRDLTVWNECFGRVCMSQRTGNGNAQYLSVVCFCSFVRTCPRCLVRAATPLAAEKCHSALVQAISPHTFTHCNTDFVVLPRQPKHKS